MSGPRGMVSRLQLGIFVTVFGVTSFVGLFVRSQSKRLFVPKVEIRADFRTTTGLRKGSSVQLAGVEVGSVSRIDFVQKRYECDPLTEDVGRFGHGRRGRARCGRRAPARCATAAAGAAGFVEERIH